MRKSLTIVVLMLSVFAGEAKAAKLCASRLTDLPEPLTNNAVTSVLNSDGSYSLYSFTGIDGPMANNRATLEAYRLDVSTSSPAGEWMQIASAPGVDGFRPKVGASAIAVGTDVYLLGGYSIRGGAETTEKELYRYDAANDNYVQLAPVPVEVDDTVVGVYGDRFIYTVSGWHGPTNGNVENVQIYDTLNDTWQQATPMPEVRDGGLFGHSGTLIGDRIVVADGVTDAGGFLISDEVLVGQIDPNDLTTITWTRLPAHPGLPTYRAAASQVATSDGRMLLVGGTDNPFNFNGIGYDGQPSLPLNQALLFDPVTFAWEEVLIEGDVLATMDHRGLVSIGDNSWVAIGGMDGPGTITDQVVAYQLVADNHVCAVPEPVGCLLLVLGVAFCGTQRRK